MQDGKPKSLQAGTNGFTCMISPDGTPLCADENGMAWNNALRSKTDPPNKIGFIYMLAGGGFCERLATVRRSWAQSVRLAGGPDTLR